MDYIQSIRKFIGHGPMLSVGVCAILENSKGEILLEKRHDNGKYCLPGGGIELRETVLEGLKREILEETGIHLNSPELFMILSGEKEVFHYPNGDITYYVDLIFYDKIKDSEKINPHDQESDNISFYSLDSLPDESELLRGTKQILDKFIKKDFKVVVD